MRKGPGGEAITIKLVRKSTRSLIGTPPSNIYGVLCNNKRKIPAIA